DRIRIVLSHPSHPGNIGATARAMKTMGLSQLVLVNPRSFPHPDADARSSNARDVLANAIVVDSLEAALAGTVLAIGAVGHRYDMAHELVSCRVAAGRAVADAAGGAAVAFVFGTETAGLTTDEMLRCNLLAHIPADPDYASLNLGAAVQVFAYELRMAAVETALPVQPAPPLATHDDIERLHVHLEQVMTRIGFFDPANPKRLLPRLRRLIARARLEVEEVRILRGLLTTLSKALKVD
ncbi:MAG: RNA methyltransferase, partial [Burkholderiales bacterium]|nr:RNA methyltransferase [Burkholderiales bacterium]